MDVLLLRVINYFNSKNINYVKWSLFFLLLFLSLFLHFFPPNYPNNNALVFDESYFVPQVESYFTGKYFFDQHPHMSRLFMYYGIKLFNPNLKVETRENCKGLTDEVERIDCNKGIIDPNQTGLNKPDDYKSYINLQGIRFFPRIFGSLLAPLMFIIAWELINSIYILNIVKLHRINNSLNKTIEYAIPFLVGVGVCLENSFIIESRFALITPFLLFFTALTIYTSLKFLFSKTITNKVNYLYLIIIGLSFGALISTKWLGLGTLPFIFIVMIFVTYKLNVEKRDKIALKLLNSSKIDHDIRSEKLNSLYNKFNFFVIITVESVARLFIVMIFGLIVYFSVFAWHFSIIKYPSNESNNNKEYQEMCPKCYEDLLNGTNNSWLYEKVYAQTRLSLKYNENVPQLDYSKSDEIGSDWLNWPLMARPIINYFSSWNMEGYPDMYAFYSLIGNPVNWYVGLLSIFTLVAYFLMRIFGNIKVAYSAGNGYKYLLLLILYFSLWLPFAFIDRVMYLYHYLQALLITFLATGLVYQDFYQHIFDNLYNKLKENTLNINNLSRVYSFSKNILYFGFLLLIIVGFFFYYPFTYLIPITKADFEARTLLREWNMKWPGR